MRAIVTLSSGLDHEIRRLLEFMPKLKFLPTLFALLLSVLVDCGHYVTGRSLTITAKAQVANRWRETPSAPSSPLPSTMPSAEASPSPSGSPNPSPSPSASIAPAAASTPTSTAVSSIPAGGKADLAVDSNGLSHVTVVINTTQGVIKFKFYPQDAPNTVNRFVELVQKGFYNGLSLSSRRPGIRDPRRRSARKRHRRQRPEDSRPSSTTAATSKAPSRWLARRTRIRRIRNFTSPGHASRTSTITTRSSARSSKAWTSSAKSKSATR